MKIFVLFCASLAPGFLGIGLVEVKCLQKIAGQIGIHLDIPSPLL